MGYIRNMQPPNKFRKTYDILACLRLANHSTQIEATVYRLYSKKFYLRLALNSSRKIHFVCIDEQNRISEFLAQ